MSNVEVARGEINLSLNEGEVTAGLDRVRAEYRAGLAEIGHMEARPSINLDTSKADRAEAEFKAKMLALGRDNVKVAVDLQTKDAEDQLLRLRAQMARLKANIAVGVEDDDAKEKLAALAAAIKAVQARKLEIEVDAKGVKRAIAEVEALDNLRARTNQAEISRTRDLQRARSDELKQSTEIVRMQERYVKLAKEHADIQKLSKRQQDSVDVKLKTARLDAELLELKAKLAALGHDAPSVDLNLSRWDRAKSKLGNDIDKLQSGLGKLGTAKINIGPLSLTLRGLVATIALLGPVVTSLIGGLTSLVGVLGTSVAVGFAAAGGGAVGLALDLGGVFAAIKPVISEFSSAREALKAYTTAVDKYGSKSTEAVSAQKTLNNVLVSVSPAARDAATQLGVVETAWHKMTAATAQKDVGKTLVAGVKTAAALLPGFAKNTNTTMGILSDATDRILKKLREPANVKMLDSLGNSANRFLQPALKGVEALGAAFLHVGSAAAHIFAGKAGDGFEKWAQDIEKATMPGAKLNSELEHMGQQAADVLHLFDSVGKLLLTVFKESSDAGDSLVKSMSHATESWRKFLDTTKGEKEAGKFFKESARDVEVLFGALNPLIAAFGEWSSALIPISTGFLKIITWASRAFEMFDRLIGLKGPLEALGVTLGVAFGVGKINSIVKTVKSLAGLLGKIVGIGGGASAPIVAGGNVAAERIGTAMVAAGDEAAAAMAAAMRSGGIPGGLPGRGLEKDATTGAEDVGEGVVGAEGVEGLTAAAEGAGGLTAALGGLDVLLGPVGIGLTALSVAGILVANHFLKAKNTTAEWTHATNEALTANTNLYRNMPKHNTALAENSSALHQAKKELDSYHGSMQGREEKEENYNKVLTAQNKLIHEGNTETEKNVEGLKSKLTAGEKVIKNDREKVTMDKRDPMDTQNIAQATEILNKALAKQAAVQRTLGQAENTRAALAATAARALTKLPALNKTAEQAVGKLSRSVEGGAVAAKAISTKYYSSSNVASVSGAAQTALGKGASLTAVLKIVADASSAKNAIKDLEGLHIPGKKVAITADNKVPAQAHLAMASLGQLPPSVATRILAHDGASGPAKTARQNILLVPTAHKSDLLASVFGTSNVLALVNAIDSLPESKTSLVIARTIEEHTAINTGVGGIPVGHATGGVVTRGGMYSKPTLLVGEENRAEYVIATNPAYRMRNLEYLEQAASALGADQAAKGKAAKPKAALHTSGPVKKLINLSVPGAFSAAGVPEGPISEASSKLTTLLKSQESALRSATNSLHAEQKTLAKTKSKTTKKSAEEKIAEYQTLIATIKGGGKYKGTAYENMGNLKANATKAEQELKAVKSTNANLVRLNTEIETRQTELGNIKSDYDRTGNPGDIASWNSVLASRKGLVSQAELAYEKQIAAAKGVVSKINTNEMKQFLAEAEHSLAGAQSSREENEAAINPQSEAEGTTANEAPSAEQFIKAMGRSPELASLQESLALAETNNLPDNPNTPQNEELPTLSDDFAATGNLKTFWEKALGEASQLGAPANVITEIAKEVTGARSAYSGLQSTIESAKAAAESNAYADFTNAESARQELFTSFGSNFSPLSPSSSGGESGKIVNVNVANHFEQPPADPHSWSNSLSWELGAAI